MSMNRRAFGTRIGVGLGAALCLPAIARGADKQTLLIAEPVHGTGYLPLYVAIRKGFFDPEDLAVRVVTIESSGSGHINAVLSGQAFAFIGGPEHNAFAKLKGAEIRAVANVVDRGNVYLVAKNGVAADGNDLAATLKGKAIAGGFYGGTPNSITRYLAIKAGLSPTEDIKIVETTAAGALAAMKAGQVQFATVTEPQVTQGIRAGLWGEPFYNVPKALGPYAYSTLNVRKESIDKDPKAVGGFARGVTKALQFTYDNPDEAAAIAKLEFPTMPPDDLRATLDRSFRDEMWSHNGMVSEQAWATAKSVVMAAGLLKQDVPYADIIDMSFVAKA
jgi:NitT/TauT family transport system substrate-binding protein